MQISKRYLVAYGALVLALATTAGVTYATFSDKAKITGTTFSTGSTDIKFLADTTLGTSAGNLVDNIQGPTFTNIYPGWDKYMPIKIYNNSTTAISLSSAANYATANDPDDLRTYIYVSPYIWNDVNNDGIYTGDEQGQNLGEKSITKWKTEGFEFGMIQPGETKSLVIYFYTNQTLTDAKQGKTGVFDFEFTSWGL